MPSVGSTSGCHSVSSWRKVLPVFGLATVGVLFLAGIATWDVLAHPGEEVGPFRHHPLYLIAAIATLAAVAMAAVVLLLFDVRQTTIARTGAEAAAARERAFLHEMLDAMPACISLKDEKGRYVFRNKAARDFTGSHAAETERRRHWRGSKAADFFQPELVDQIEEEDRHVLETGEPLLAREKPVVMPEGRIAWYSTTKLPLRDPDGALRGLLCVHVDITARKAAEEKLRVFAGLLEQSNVELRDFAGVASHDLQEPLRKIQAFSDRVRVKGGAALGPEGLDSLERIQNAASRMQTLIQDLLVLSRISSRDYRVEPVDLNWTVHEVLKDFALRIERSGAKVEVGPLPTVEADAFQMRQMFQNLIGNALKFHKPGQRPEITVQGKLLRVQDYHLSGAAPGDEVAQIMVTDNGIGFDEEYVEKVFTLFARLHTPEEYEGTGIGLAVCRKIAQRHGGSIVAKSAKGQGATLMLMLPVRQKVHPSEEGAP